MLKILNMLRNIILKSKFVSKQQDGSYVYTITSSSFGQLHSVEVIYPYGYGASVPEDGVGLDLSVSCQPENKVTFPYEPKTRWKGLSEGEVKIGNQKVGNSIKFNSDGSILIEGDVTIKGNLTSSGNVSDSKSSMESMRETYNQHVHIDSTGNLTQGPQPEM